MIREVCLTEEWLKKWAKVAVSSEICYLVQEIHGIDEAIEEALDAFCTHVRGTPDESSMVIESSTKEESFAGQIVGSFEEVWHVGCKDMDGSSVNEFRLRFQVKPEQQTLTLQWEETDDRFPNEEL